MDSAPPPGGGYGIDDRYNDEVDESDDADHGDDDEIHLEDNHAGDDPVYEGDVDEDGAHYGVETDGDAGWPGAPAEGGGGATPEPRPGEEH